MFKDVVIIEDRHGLIKKLDKQNRDFISETKLFNEPMNIYDIEEYEEKLDKQNIPYVLAEVSKRSDINGKSKWVRGYCLFTDFGYDITMLSGGKKAETSLYKELKKTGKKRKEILSTLKNGE